jgi:multidrug efflux pump subunit AcrA (membrane-fusion protein)
VTPAPSAAAVMTIADLSAMQVRADIPELDVGQVAAGQPVDVRINALPGQTVPGMVAMVNLLPGSGSAVQYGTSVALTAPPLGLRPGMSASVSIVTRSVSNVPFLPSAAIRAAGEGSTTGTVDVLVGPDNHREARTIGLGLSSDTVTQVTSGLTSGELVVLPDPNTADPFQGGGGPPGTQGGDRNRGGSGGSGGGSGGGG